MENTSLINQNKFEDAKLMFKQLTEFTEKNNENIRLQNNKIENTQNLVSKVGEIYNESKRIDNENLQLKKELVEIVGNFKQNQSIIQNIFSERGRIIDKHFELIDKGMRENDDKMILEGLRAASQFVITNPLENFDDFKKALMDKNKPLELDF